MELPPAECRGLNVRSIGGVTARLMWLEGTEQTFVTVEDTKGGNFSVEVPTPDLANRIFLHPFAYREQRGAK